MGVLQNAAVNHAKLSILDMEMILENSETLYQDVELVGVEFDPYDEQVEASSGAEQILDHAYLSQDPYFTDFRVWEEQYSADVTVFFTHDIVWYVQGGSQNINGVTRAIKACTDASFALVDASYSIAYGYHSFTHEIGHILGLGHDDDYDRPIWYGHGHIGKDNYNNKFKTIMGIGSNLRIPYFSTDDVNPYIDITTAGGYYENSEQAINDYMNILMSHRPTTGIRIIELLDLTEWTKLGDIYHPNAIHTNSFCPVVNPNTKILAGVEVALNDGFTCDLTSLPSTTLDVGIIDPVCGVYNEQTCYSSPSGAAPQPTILENEFLQNKINVFPTKIEQSEFQIINEYNECAKIELLNLNGEVISKYETCKNSDYFKIQPLKYGYYFIRVRIENKNINQSFKVLIY